MTTVCVCARVDNLKRYIFSIFDFIAAFLVFVCFSWLFVCCLFFAEVDSLYVQMSGGPNHI